MIHFFIRALVQSSAMAQPKTTVLVKMLFSQWKSDNPTVTPGKLDETVTLYIYKTYKEQNLNRVGRIKQHDIDVRK
jgi:hypothetical protein